MALGQWPSFRKARGPHGEALMALPTLVFVHRALCRIIFASSFVRLDVAVVLYTTVKLGSGCLWDRWTWVRQIRTYYLQMAGCDHDLFATAAARGAERWAISRTTGLNAGTQHRAAWLTDNCRNDHSSVLVQVQPARACGTDPCRREANDGWNATRSRSAQLVLCPSFN
jgi:hypothetical protein